MSRIPNPKVRFLLGAGVVAVTLGLLIGLLMPQTRQPPIVRPGIEGYIPAMFSDERAYWFVGGLLFALIFWYHAVKLAITSALSDKDQQGC